jgi:hypothetical protein
VRRKPSIASQPETKVAALSAAAIKTARRRFEPPARIVMRIPQQRPTSREVFGLSSTSFKPADPPPRGWTGRTRFNARGD